MFMSVRCGNFSARTASKYKRFVVNRPRRFKTSDNKEMFAQVKSILRDGKNVKNWSYAVHPALGRKAE